MQETQTSRSMNKLLIIDTFNFLHRAYHALPKTFHDLNGEPTNAVYGVTSMLINLLGQLKPTHVIAALDGEKPTFRVEDFTAYKAHRKPMEDDLSSQIPKVFEILDAFGIKKVVVDGYEADDVIGTLSKRFGDKSGVFIVSNDRDLWQLSDNSITIMLPGQKGEFDLLGRKEAVSRLGFDPEKVPDYKGLRGDPSDNIPGVFGVGEKTATKLIQDFGSLEEIYRRIEEVKPDSLKEKLLNCYEQALMSKKLANIILNVPVQLELPECKYTTFNIIRVKTVLEKYNFKSLIKRLGFEVAKKEQHEEEEENTNQLSLFS